MIIYRQPLSAITYKYTSSRLGLLTKKFSLLLTLVATMFSLLLILPNGLSGFASPSDSQRYTTALSYLDALGHDLGFENGSFENGWGWGRKEAVDPSRLQRITNPVIQGGYSLQVTANIRDSVSNGVRAEIVRSDCTLPNCGMFTDGDEVWYHWYVRFPSSLVIPPSPSGAVFTQWHQATGTSECYDAEGGRKYACGGAVPILFTFTKYNASHPDKHPGPARADGETMELLVINKTDVYHDTSNPNGLGYGADRLWFMRIDNRDAWYEFVYHANWTTCGGFDTNGKCGNHREGFQELWVNGVKQEFHFPSMHYNMDEYIDPSNPVPLVYMKQGLYLCTPGNPKCPQSPETFSLIYDGMEYLKCSDIPENDPNKRLFCGVTSQDPGGDPLPADGDVGGDNCAGAQEEADFLEADIPALQEDLHDVGPPGKAAIVKQIRENQAQLEKLKAQCGVS